MVANSIRWISIPVLLVASMFSRYAASGEHLVDFVICLGAIVFLCRAAWMREYYWGAGVLAIVVVFSPLSLALKIFVLMAFTCLAAFVALVVALGCGRRRRPTQTAAPIECDPAQGWRPALVSRQSQSSQVHSWADRSAP